MKLLILVHNLTGGGAERAAALWAKGFVDRGHEVGLVMCSPSSSPITYRVPDIVKLYNIYDVTKIGVLNRVVYKLFEKADLRVLYVRKLSVVINSFVPDTIIGVMHPWAEVAMKASSGSNIPIINTEHSSFERPVASPMPSKIKRMKYEWNKHYDWVTVLTEADKKCLKGIISNVSVLPNPLAYCPLKKIPPKKDIILAAGRLGSWNKGFDILVHAWGLIAKNYPNWILEIAGQDRGNAQRDLQLIADKYNLGNQISFLGFQSEILTLYRRSSIFVLSSRNEGFGMVLIEAMSQGCASIACDFKGRQSEIITSSEEGIICPPDDIIALSKAIEKLINDKDYRKMVQINGMERSKAYDLGIIMDKWDEILNKVCK